MKGAAVQAKPYPKYDESGVEWLGEVPDHWGIIPLKYLASLKSGDSITSEQIEEFGEYPVYGGNGLRGYTKKYTHDGHYILIGRQGALCGNINYARGKFWASEHALVVNPLQEFESSWMGELLRAMNLGQYSISAAQPGLSVEIIANLRIPVPPLPEQKTIAAYLGRETAKIDKLIARQERLIELSQEKRRALISHTVTRGLDEMVKLKDSGVEWLGEVPEHWEIVPLKYLTSLKSGDSITSEQIEESGKYPVYGGNGLRGYTTNYTHNGEYILIGRQGALCGNINYAKGKFWASEHAVVANPLQEFESSWMGELLRAMNLGQYSISAAQPGLSVEIIANLRIPVPPRDEQRAIAIYIDNETAKIEALVTKAKRAIELMREHRSALIAAAVTGQIDVREFT